MKQFLMNILLSALFVPGTVSAGDRLTVVASIPALKAIAGAVGGDRVEAFAIATGFQNPHFVDPKPSFILKLSRADVFITVGLDLETGWVPSLLQSSRNGKIQPGAQGYVDASRNIGLLQIPSVADRAHGDIHAYGNPHYWLDPLRGKQIARNICETFIRLSPENSEYFRGNLKKFEDELDVKTSEWVKQMEPFRGLPVIAYHNEWPYFEERFGFRIVDFLEPKPGIPPTPSQLVKVISAIKSGRIPVIITSPYFTLDAAEMVSKQTGAAIAVLAPSVEAVPEILTYFDLFDYNVKVMLRALGGESTR